MRAYGWEWAMNLQGFRGQRCSQDGHRTVALGEFPSTHLSRLNLVAMVEFARTAPPAKGVRFMEPPNEVSPPDLACAEAADTTDEAEYLPDPSAAFLDRKARLRAEAAQRPRQAGADQRGEYRGNTSSGAWLPLMHGRGK
jgi:hypothetical protein